MRKNIIIRLILLAALTAAGYLGYRAGIADTMQRVESMEEEIHQLKQTEQQANITRRVSMQMEDIAYQQKEISDKQRLRAEEQSLLALQNAQKAEEESHLAHQAEQRARLMAEEAQLERDRAEQQQKEALLERDRATHAKNVSDTLTYRRLGNTLGANAVEQGNQDPEIANKMAYWSWYFHKNYGGNTYYQESFMALCNATGGIGETAISNSSIHGLISDENGENLYAASNYGEIIQRRDENEHSTVIYHNKRHDFRDLERVGNRLFALDVSGTVMTCTTDSRHKVDSISLTEDRYFRIIKVRSDVLVLLGRHNIHFLNTSHMPFRINSISLSRSLSTAMLCEDRICVFYEDGEYEELSRDGAPLQPRVFQDLRSMRKSNGKVTAANYDSKTGIISLGNDKGDLHIYNRWGRQLVSFNSRWGAVRDLSQIGDVVFMAFSSKNVQLIYLPRVRYDGGTGYEEQRNSPMPVARHAESGIGAEWLVPVRLTLTGWPQVLIAQPAIHRVIVGLSNGRLASFNTSADDMAETLRNRYIGKDMTEDQWTHYVSSHIPYMTIQ